MKVFFAIVFGISVLYTGIIYWDQNYEKNRQDLLRQQHYQELVDQNLLEWKINPTTGERYISGKGCQ